VGVAGRDKRSPHLDSRTASREVGAVTTLDPLATVLAFSGMAALAAAFGALPEALRVPLPRAVIGWANALAGGLMLGVAYTLLTEGLEGGLLAGGLGALLGMAFVRGTHAAAGTGELDLDSPETGTPGAGHKALLVEALHAADEGIAIGAAMAVKSVPAGSLPTAAMNATRAPARLQAMAWLRPLPPGCSA
jgi:hypothetical protein